MVKVQIEMKEYTMWVSKLLRRNPTERIEAATFMKKVNKIVKM